MLIGITFDLRDEYRKLGYSEETISEFDSVETIDAIEKALNNLGHNTERVGNIWQLTKAMASGKRWDMVFNIAEGMHGIAREAQVPALLEAYEIPYTFSSPEVTVMCHDKALAKQLVAKAGIATAKYHVAHNTKEIEKISLDFPLFVKPLAEGTGKGISAKSLVKNPKQLISSVRDLLERFNQPVLIESYLPGREFTVGVLGTGENARTIGALEVILKPGAEAGGHTYHNKENCETLIEYKVANDKIAKNAEKLALNAWLALGCRDGGRIDIRCDSKDIPHFLEANPLAGLNPTHSDLPILATGVGLSYNDLLGEILESASKRIKSMNLSSEIKGKQICL